MDRVWRLEQSSLRISTGNSSALGPPSGVYTHLLRASVRSSLSAAPPAFLPTCLPTCLPTHLSSTSLLPFTPTSLWKTITMVFLSTFVYRPLNLARHMYVALRVRLQAGKGSAAELSPMTCVVFLKTRKQRSSMGHRALLLLCCTSRINNKINALSQVSRRTVEVCCTRQGGPTAAHIADRYPTPVVSASTIIVHPLCKKRERNKKVRLFLQTQQRAPYEKFPRQVLPSRFWAGMPWRGECHDEHMETAVVVM